MTIHWSDKPLAVTQQHIFQINHIQNFVIVFLGHCVMVSAQRHNKIMNSLHKGTFLYAPYYVLKSNLKNTPPMLYFLQT